MRRPVLGLLSVLSLGGCQLAPEHTRPKMPTAPTYAPEHAGDVTIGARARDIGWRDFFDDPRLEALITVALTRNRDLAVAVAQIDEARGLYGIESAQRWPALDLGASASRSRVNTVAGPVTGNRFAVGLTTAFELDFWGRARNLSEIARSQYVATVEAQRAFRLSLIRSVASAYLISLETSERIQLAQATVRSRREGLEIARIRAETGITSELDFRQAEALLTEAEAALAALSLTLARTNNALTVLLGGPYERSLPAAAPLAKQLRADTTLAVGLPSELLVARPDIIAAEERLRAASANIGAARAAFFPSITLTGNLGFASSELSELVSSDSLEWGFGPSLNLPIFNRARLSGNLEVARARRRIAIASYQRAIQTAFQEVADALAARRYIAEQAAAQERGVTALRQIAELAKTRYLEGVVGYLEVLDAERNLFASEQALLQLRGAEVENLVALYIVLGGGAVERTESRAR